MRKHGSMHVHAYVTVTENLHSFNNKNAYVLVDMVIEMRPWDTSSYS